MQKENFRNQLKSARDGMKAEDAAAKSLVITQKLLSSVDWAKIRSLHIYKSELGWNEVDTAPIIKSLRESWPDIAITTPSKEKEQAIPIEQFDLIIVPVLGFDKDNYRLGLGAGFYDRFLASQPKALRIGLAYQSALVKNLPHEPHDVPLDKEITEV